MYKVLIIDDEPIIVEGLTRVIDWESHHCKIVATGSNGHQGMELIRKHHPDMVFTDIAMPGMDGLQMIAGIRSEQPQLLISILTGYRDFDFAQQAIKLGVSRFLLKPSKLSELEEAVTFMVGELDKRPNTEESVASAPEAEAPAETEGEGTAGSFIVRNALEYLDTHYAEKITLTELADKMYVSQWHLSKLLNKHMKKSFSDLLNEVRIREAKKLLMDPALRVGDVAEKVGFLDIAHFSRVFKKYTEMSANEYRNKKLG